MNTRMESRLQPVGACSSATAVKIPNTLGKLIPDQLKPGLHTVKACGRALYRVSFLNYWIGLCAGLVIIPLLASLGGELSATLLAWMVRAGVLSLASLIAANTLVGIYTLLYRERSMRGKESA